MGPPPTPFVIAPGTTPGTEISVQLAWMTENQFLKNTYILASSPAFVKKYVVDLLCQHVKFYIITMFKKVLENKRGSTQLAERINATFRVKPQIPAG